MTRALDIRPAELYDALMDRLNTVHMRRILHGLGPAAAPPAATRLYLISQYSGKPETESDTVWGRGILMPRQAAPGATELAYNRWLVGWFIRFEFNNYKKNGWDASVSLGAAQAEAFAQWQHWIPGTYLFVKGAGRVQRRDRQEHMLYDERLNVWYVADRYDVEVTTGSAPAT